MSTREAGVMRTDITGEFSAAVLLDGVAVLVLEAPAAMVGGMCVSLRIHGNEQHWREWGQYVSGGVDCWKAGEVQRGRRLRGS